jgi:hypothetical protein
MLKLWAIWKEILARPLPPMNRVISCLSPHPGFPSQFAKLSLTVGKHLSLRVQEKSKVTCANYSSDVFESTQTVNKDCTTLHSRVSKK